MSATAVLRIISVRVTTGVAERALRLRSVIITCAVATASDFTSVGFAIVAFTGFAAFTHTPAMAPGSYTLRGSCQMRRIRTAAALGAISFIVANLGAALGFDIIEPRHLIWVSRGVGHRNGRPIGLAVATADRAISLVQRACLTTTPPPMATARKRSHFGRYAPGCTSPSAFRPYGIG